MSNEIITTAITAGIGAVATVTAAFIGVRIGRRPEKEDPKQSYAPEAARKAHRYDVFISSPLAGFASDEEIKADHDRIAPIVDCLENELKLRVFWAGRNIRSKSEFEDPGLSAIDDVEALKASKWFLLFYPKKIASSVLFEAGIALRSCLSSIYIVENKNDLPFLMASAAEVFSNVRLCKASLPNEMLALLRKNGKSLLEPNDS